MSGPDTSNDKQETIESATEEKVTVGLAFFRNMQEQAKKGRMLPSAVKENIELKNKVKEQQEEINKLSQSLVTTSKLIKKEMPREIRIRLELTELSQWSIILGMTDEGKFMIKDGAVYLTYDTEQRKITSYSYS